MRVAIIDIGSNSTKLIIGEDSDGKIKILDSFKNIIGIGKNTFYKGRISQDIFNQVISVLEKYKKAIFEYAVDEVKVIATTAVREAENKDIFLDTIHRKTGFAVEVLNIGDVVYYIDAFLSYKLKKAYPIHEKNLLIAELGAGNLDVSFMERGYTLINIGIPIGTLRLKQFKNRIDASQKETYEALDEYIENELMSLKRIFPQIKIDDIILIDESYSAALHKVLPNKKREPSFFSFKARESKQLTKKVTNFNLDDFSSRYDISQDISASIDGYALILSNLFKLIRQRSFYILETSLAEALLANILFGVELSKKYNKENQLISVAKFLCRKYGSDSRHTRHVAFLAEELFRCLKDHLGLNDSDRLYLALASHLHNVGLFLTNRGYHKHSEYIINALSLFRLTELEIKVIACIARYHRKATPQKSHFLYSSLASEQQIVVQKLSSILRIANALDGSHKQKVKKLEVAMGRKQEMVLTVYASESFALEKVSFLDMKQLYEDVSGTKINLVVKKQSA